MKNLLVNEKRDSYRKCKNFSGNENVIIEMLDL